MNSYKMILIAGLMVSVAACGGEDAEEANTVEDPYDGPTYHSDIKPLMDAHCTSCHVPDSIAPFALETYEQVKSTAVLSHTTMASGTMPPWQPADDCGTFQGHRGMSDDEISVFEEWIELDYVEGEPSQETESEAETESELVTGSPDNTLDWGFDYKPEPVGGDGIDDYRCFVVDLELEEDRFVNLVDTHPGNAEIVHHMIAYSAPASQADHIAQLEAEDDRPGYTCFGGPRLSNFEMLAGWVPGSVPLPYQDGHGVRLEAESKLVIQMHYNTLNDPEGTDRTELDLYYIDEEEYPNPTELVMIPLGDYDLFVEAGDPDGLAYAESQSIPFNLTLHGIAPHMHTLGTQIHVEASTGDGDICLIDVPDWDFNWQGFYLYEEPMELSGSIQTRLTCRYDNSPENQQGDREPRDITWGDGTFDEMCLVYFIIERPPGF